MNRFYSCAISLFVLSAGCGDDTSATGAGGGAGSGGAGGGEPLPVLGTAQAFIVSEAGEPVTVSIDSPDGATLDLPPYGGVGGPSLTRLNLRACADPGTVPTCANVDFGTVAGPTEIPAADGDVISVLGPQANWRTRSELEAPTPGNTVIALLESSTHPGLTAAAGYQLGADFTFFDWTKLAGQQVPLDAELAIDTGFEVTTHGLVPQVPSIVTYFTEAGETLVLTVCPLDASAGCVVARQPAP